MGKRIVEQTIKRMRVPEENSRIEWDAYRTRFDQLLANTWRFITSYGRCGITFAK